LTINEEDFDHKNNPMMEDDNDNEVTYTTRRSMTMLHKQGLPFKRRSHDVGLNYLMPNKKDKRRS
jgi:hypothetical protein